MQPPVKLIAVDMDGTLLNDQKELPEDFFEIVQQLHDHDIRMVIASGRQCYNLFHLFEPVKELLYFLCENGAMLFDGTKLLWNQAIAQKRLILPFQEAVKHDGVFPVLCGVKSAWCGSSDPEFLANARLYYAELRVVPDMLSAAAGDSICKIACFDRGDAEHSIYPAMQPFAGEYMVTLAGPHWVDLMNPGINKGSAMIRLQQLLQTNPGESMAFGDYLNDLELLKVCDYSYAMANAHPDLKRICRFTTEYSNNQAGVTRTLRTLFPFLN